MYTKTFRTYIGWIRHVPRHTSLKHKLFVIT